ncbi:RIB43A-like with coiled-coils protein 2 [Fopius arisanus]|uniref:RIB43A-like with coiled-coils protein 2 n=2 Tax=Fopius arisanus TaxID=64838 RepID=A0A9R1SUS8_9HYME|nr:PREDICTED: RIB43A-like with coiled-coils protein 2 [Fopius arisanus]
MMMTTALVDWNYWKMLKFQKATKEDLKAAACIERKKQIEEARKSRIFNPRVRRIGIDKEFLDKQIAEKQQLRQLEREKEHQLDETLVRNSQLAIILEQREEEERRKLNQEINNYRQVFQRTENRREFDLYDPDLLKKSSPARVDDDPRIGVASAQKFEGEDPHQAERLKLQKEQMQAWLMQQVHERRSIEHERKNAEDAHQEAVLSRDKRAIMLDRMEIECRRHLEEANAQFNRKLAGEQDQRRRVENFQDEENNRAEIFNHVTGDFLMEAKVQAGSSLGPHRVLADRYKGMTLDELKAIWAEQLQQMDEIQRMRAEERRRNDEWDRLMEGNARAGEQYQRELDRKRSQISRQIADENLRLAHEQRTRQEYLNQKVYKEEHMPEFFKQFNTSTR